MAEKSKYIPKPVEQYFAKSNHIYLWMPYGRAGKPTLPTAGLLIEKLRLKL
jgi:hypothetical protein